MEENKNLFMNNPLVSITIVNWNGMKYLPDCLGSLSEIDYKNIEVFFVDNASTDNSVKYVRKNYPHYKLILNSKNLGYAEGHEEAFKLAKGELLLLLSMDTIVEKDFLQQMVTAITKKNDIGAVQPKLLMYPDTELIDSIGSFFLETGILYHYGREKNHIDPKYNSYMEVFSGKGACLLFRRKALLKTGLFDKDFFAYFEETDLCHRIWLSGFRIVYEPSAVVYHTGGGASKRMIVSYIQFHSFKNRICAYIKNLSPKYIMRVIPQAVLLYEVATIAYILLGRFSVALAVQKSLLWNVVHLGETLKKRKIVQEKVRTVSDDSFLPSLTRPVRLSYYYYLFKGLGFYKD